MEHNGEIKLRTIIYDGSKDDICPNDLIVYNIGYLRDGMKYCKTIDVTVYPEIVYINTNNHGIFYNKALNAFSAETYDGINVIYNGLLHEIIEENECCMVYISKFNNLTEIADRRCRIKKTKCPAMAVLWAADNSDIDLRKIDFGRKIIWNVPKISDGYYDVTIKVIEK